MPSARLFARGRETDLRLAGTLKEPREEVARTVFAVRLHHRVERIEPLGGLGGISVGELVDRAVEDHVDILAGRGA